MRRGWAVIAYMDAPTASGLHAPDGVPRGRAAPMDSRAAQRERRLQAQASVEQTRWEYSYAEWVARYLPEGHDASPAAAASMPPLEVYSVGCEATCRLVSYISLYDPGVRAQRLLIKAGGHKRLYDYAAAGVGAVGRAYAVRALAFLLHAA